MYFVVQRLQPQGLPKRQTADGRGLLCKSFWQAACLRFGNCKRVLGRKPLPNQRVGGTQVEGV